MGFPEGSPHTDERNGRRRYIGSGDVQAELPGRGAARRRPQVRTFHPENVFTKQNEQETEFEKCPDLIRAAFWGPESGFVLHNRHIVDFPQRVP